MHSFFVLFIITAVEYLSAVLSFQSSSSWQGCHYSCSSSRTAGLLTFDLSFPHYFYLGTHKFYPGVAMPATCVTDRSIDLLLSHLLRCIVSHVVL